MRRAGVIVLPGTDAPLRNSPPGFGLTSSWPGWSKRVCPVAGAGGGDSRAGLGFGMQDRWGRCGRHLADWCCSTPIPGRLRNTRRINTRGAETDAA